jgi:hypothetical protein
LIDVGPERTPQVHVPAFLRIDARLDHRPEEAVPDEHESELFRGEPGDTHLQQGLLGPVTDHPFKGFALLVRPHPVPVEEEQILVGDAGQRTMAHRSRPFAVGVVVGIHTSRLPDAHRPAR